MGIFDAVKNLFTPATGPKLSIVDVAKRFDLVGRTGQGSMSKVWRAYDRKLGRTICLKVLDKEKTAKFEARFLKMHKPSEGEICLALHHENIVRTFEYGLTTQKEPFLVMELIEGVGLNFLIETKSPELKGKRIKLLCELADGLEYLHKSGFLHRDICPRNAMVTSDGVLKLIDFGLAIPNKPAFCQPGNRTGTRTYLAPELIRRQATDHRVDMFALGVTAYEVFTGDLPWERAAAEKMLRNMVNADARDPRELNKALDAATAACLLKSVDRDPSRRYQTPAQFRDALKALPEHW